MIDLTREQQEKIADVLAMAIDDDRENLRKMGREALTSDALQNRVLNMVDNALDVDPTIAGYIRKVLGFGVDKLLDFLDSPQHRAVVQTFDELSRQNGGGWSGRRKAKRQLRKRMGGFFWRRKIRKAVKRALG